MKPRIIELLSEEIRETRNLTIAVRKQTKAEVAELKKIALAALKEAKSARRQADASWELVVITRNQVQEEITYLKKPIWKKWLGN